jgi:3-mercaptopyruvate sulfurtransferase SseA
MIRGNRTHIVIRIAALACSLALVVLASCGGAPKASPVSTVQAKSGVGHRMLALTPAYKLLHDPPPGLVVLDVRTPEEFAAGHIAGASNVDLNSATFATAVAKLDPKLPYFVYCHSGNRSRRPLLT